MARRGKVSRRRKVSRRGRRSMNRSKVSRKGRRGRRTGRKPRSRSRLRRTKRARLYRENQKQQGGAALRFGRSIPQTAPPTLSDYSSSVPYSTLISAEEAEVRAEEQREELGREPKNAEEQNAFFIRTERGSDLLRGTWPGKDIPALPKDTVVYVPKQAEETTLIGEDRYRRGTYKSFEEKWVGANLHTISFDDGTETLKLKDMPHWRYEPK